MKLVRIAECERGDCLIIEEISIDDLAWAVHPTAPDAWRRDLPPHSGQALVYAFPGGTRAELGAGPSIAAHWRADSLRWTVVYRDA